jgi:pimeloyl-ACP methyl ester carboxylesterase
MKLEDDVPTMDETLVALEEIFSTENIEKATWMGHSLGSVICSWVCRERPQWLSKVVLLDPVVFKLWEHDVAFNFMYRPPKTGIDLLMWYFVVSYGAPL